MFSTNDQSRINFRLCKMSLCRGHCHVENSITCKECVDPAFINSGLYKFVHAFGPGCWYLLAIHSKKSIYATEFMFAGVGMDVTLMCDILGMSFACTCYL